MSKDNLIPELRFPEFENEGEWEEKKLGDMTIKVGSGVTPLGGELNYKKYGRPFVRSQNVSWGVFLLDDIALIDEATHQNSINTEIEIEDVLLNITGASIGRSAVANKFVVGGNVNQHVCIIRAQRELLNPYFFNQFLISDFGQKQIDSFQAGGNRQGLNFAQIRSFSIRIPQLLQEQQKIASCLSSLDEVISAHTQKLDTLKDHKKGLMQNLFPQEGETVPKYRFPEFENDGEWVEKKLGEIADFINGKAYKQEELLSNGKFRVLRVGNLFTNNKWYYSDLELDDDKYCESGDLLYAWSASFGPHMWTEEKVIYHYHIWKVKNKIGLNKQFLFYLLDYDTFRMKAKSLNGFALMHITKGTIENWDSFIPKYEKEQEKIATCLSSLDSIITAQSERIEQLKLHKKGLMQGLFPKID